MHFSFENRISIRYNTPHLYHVTMTDSVWALPFSLAATNGISIDFFSSSYSDASLRTVRSPKLKQGSVKRDLIRTSWDLRSHAPTPGLSQLATSFFAYQAESSTNRRLCTNYLAGILNSRKVLVVSQHYNTSEVYAIYTRKYSNLTSPHNLLLSELLGRIINTS